jgi:hypothetical protein
MKIINTILFVFITITVSYPQRYFNDTIPSLYGDPFWSVNANALYLYNNKYLMTGIYASENNGTSSVITSFDDNRLFNNHFFEDLALSNNALSINGDKIGFAAKNRRIRKGSINGVLDSNFNITKVDTIITDGVYNFPTNLYGVNGFLFTTLFTRDDEGIYNIGVAKYDMETGFKWYKKYEDNIGYAYNWTIIGTNNHNLLSSYTLRYNNTFGGNAYVKKIDYDGNLLWRTQPMEKIDGGAAKIHIAELSNQNIIVNYRKDMWSEYEFWCCLHPRPPTFVLLDKDGNILRENTLRIPKTQIIEFLGIKQGKGDYYFGYGQHAFDSEFIGQKNYYGFITKYNNVGDTIWTKLYRHENHDRIRTPHIIKDILELDNGDILVLGEIEPTNARGEIWILKIGEHGCLSSDPCDDDVQIVVSTQEIEPKEEDFLKVYPNPTYDFIRIESSSVYDAIEIFNSMGQRILSYSNHNGLYDVSILNAGFYLVLLKNRGITVGLSKLVKQ